MPWTALLLSRRMVKELKIIWNEGTDINYLCTLYPQLKHKYNFINIGLTQIPTSECQYLKSIVN